MNWYVQVLKNYATFTGRARRKEFWMFALFNAIIITLGYALVAIVAIAGSGTLTAIVYALLGLYGLAVVIPGLAVTIRRLHDTGKSGWWIFITFVPLVGQIWLIVLLATDSQLCDNQYGPNPKASEVVAQ